MLASERSDGKSMSRSRITIFTQAIGLTFLICLVACGQVQKTASAPLLADKTRYGTDLTFIARAPRTVVDAHHQDVQDLCAERFSALGFTVERYKYSDGVDVIGTLPGTSRPNEIVIVSAHYDTIMGGDGADDNASGVAAVLESARLLAAGRNERTLIAACWDEEEPAETGSYRYAIRAKAQQDQIQVAYVYDEIGYSQAAPNSQKFPAGFKIAYPLLALKMQANQYRANFIMLIYDTQARVWGQTIATVADRENLPSAQLEVNLNGKVTIELRGSDHNSFWGKGYSAIEITDTAGYRNPYQHTNLDTVDRLDNDFSVKVISAVVASVQAALNP
jgi:Zn-dependent M28 family amino/carboxypeptidase